METQAEKARRARLKRLYSITPEEYSQILAWQDDVCPICLEAKTTKGQPKKFGVDHDHSDGLIRGVLCFSCNRQLREYWTPERLLRAHAYLVKPPATAALGQARFGRKGRITSKRKKRRRRGSS